MNAKKKKLRLIAVAELKPADMTVICEMQICPSCGTGEKSGNWRHLMCYRCYWALPPGVNKSVDGQPEAIMLDAFWKFMKALSRTHAFLVRRGVACDVPESALAPAPAPDPVAAKARMPSPNPAPVAVKARMPAPNPAPVAAKARPVDEGGPLRRANTARNDDNWNTIWREDDCLPCNLVKCQPIL